MTKYAMVVGVLGLALLAQPMNGAAAAIYAGQRLAAWQVGQAEPIQYGNPAGHGTPDRRRALGPRAYPGWHGGPGWRGAPAWRGPPGWSGRPYWFGRPWVRRPYYGTIVAGVALGALITVAAVGYVPVRPAPNLCWYWADPYGNQGYWDYCN